MNINMQDAARYLVLTDTLPQTGIDVVFLFTRARYDEDGLFETVLNLQKRNLVRNVVTNGSQGEQFDSNVPGKAWPGIRVWRSRLTKLGVKRIHLSRPAFHTRDEAEAFLESA